MAGHSKWKQIKHRKMATDMKRSARFSKLARYLATESRRAGGDESSPTLRAAILKARAGNLPSENIARAILKGRTDTGVLHESVTYEAYGPGGVAIIVEGLTDNRNRTSAEVRHLLKEHGGTFAQPGAASWAFAHDADGGWTPRSTVPLSESDVPHLEALVDALEAHDDVQEVFTNAE